MEVAEMELDERGRDGMGWKSQRWDRMKEAELGCDGRG